MCAQSFIKVVSTQHLLQLMMESTSLRLLKLIFLAKSETFFFITEHDIISTWFHSWDEKYLKRMKAHPSLLRRICGYWRRPWQCVQILDSCRKASFPFSQTMWINTSTIAFPPACSAVCWYLSLLCPIKSSWNAQIKITVKYCSFLQTLAVFSGMWLLVQQKYSAKRTSYKSSILLTRTCEHWIFGLSLVCKWGTKSLHYCY